MFRFEEAATQAAGDCARVADRIPASALKPGHYTYHFHIDSPAGARLDAEASFEIAS